LPYAVQSVIAYWVFIKTSGSRKGNSVESTAVSFLRQDAETSSA